MSSSVFHIRLRNFELQAERILDSSLKTRPVAIISSHRQDGTLISLSPEAEKEGLSRGMKVSLARKMSHSALLMPYNRSLYARLNHYLFSTVSSFTPIVEPSALGQFYLDMNGMHHVYPNLEQAGVLISHAISDKTSLSSAIGISINKLVSRISTATVPEMIYRIPSGNEAHFLSPLKTSVLPTAHEPAVKKMLNFLHFRQVEHVQQVVEKASESQVLFGNHNRKLTTEARGQDTSVVKPPKHRDYILEQVVLPADTNNINSLYAAVSTLAESVAFQLRKRRQIARKAVVEIHYTDGFKSSRTGSFSSNDDASITHICIQLFEQGNFRRNRIRAILVNLSRFSPFALQLNVFSNHDTQILALSGALDRIRRRHGFASIQSASALENNAADALLSENPEALPATPSFSPAPCLST